MSNTQNPLQIVVAYDFSDSAKITLSRAIALVRGEPRHMLHVIAVLDERGGLGSVHGSGKTGYDDAAEVEELLTRELEARFAEESPAYQVHFFVHVRIGDPAQLILELAKEVGAYLVMVGSHGRTGLRRLLLGSVSEKVVREAKCPVLVVRPREYEDVSLVTVVDAPPDHAEGHKYRQPHRYTYENHAVRPQSAAWPWY